MFNGQIIKRLRVREGWTQAELAQKLGPKFKKQHIYAYEKGVCAPRAATLGILAKVFNAELSIFFD